MTSVLVINAGYEPLNEVSLHHAIRMLIRKVAVIEEADPEATFGPYPRPLVLRLVRYVRAVWRTGPPPFSTRRVLVRDRHRCCYCGRHANTVDHVIPRGQGGQDSWLNTVAACLSCNGRKGCRTPEQAGMRPLYEPFVPTWWQLAAA